MQWPRNRKIFFLSAPPTFSGARLCPLEQVPIGALKLVSFLKRRGNEVVYLDMHSGEPSPWKLKPAGRGGGEKRLLYVMGRPPDRLESGLDGLDLSPDEIWISCTFSFDLDLALEYAEVLRRRFPGARMRLGGDAVRNIPASEIPGGIEVFTGRIPEADAGVPDFSVRKKWEYGLFSLAIGCMNRCAFCSIWRDRPVKLDEEAVLRYVRDLYERDKPGLFWNWDPNVLMFRGALERFLDGYAAAGIKAGVCFGKGFQPNLLTEKLVGKMVKAGLSYSTFPIESSSSRSGMLKPYTVISTIKALESAKRAGYDPRLAQTTFILGYPGEDLGSVFRSFSLSLVMGATPAPFPVFLFPGTSDYSKYAGAAARGGIVRLHGNLWPLIEDDQADKYDRLLEFLLTRDVRDIPGRIGLLTPELRGIFFREFEKSSRFVELARVAGSDSRRELERIEKEIAMRKVPRFRRLLHVTASPRSAGTSRTKLFAGHFLARFKEAYPGTRITEVDVFREKIAFMNEEFIDFVFRRKDYAQVSAKTRRLIDLTEKFIKQIEASDVVLFSTPMWSLSIPSALKAYLELVATMMFYRRKKTFAKRQVFALLTREGSYAKPGGDPSGDPFLNVQDSTLTAICGFLGLGEPHFLYAEGLRVNAELPPELEAGIKASINLSLRRTLNL